MTCIFFWAFKVAKTFLHQLMPQLHLTKGFANIKGSMTERQKYSKTERQQDNKTARQQDRKAERQKYRKIDRQQDKNTE
jgi:hypothetical protein